MNATISDSGIVVAAGRGERTLAVGLVRDFMAAMARRDMVAMRACLGSGLRIQATGGVVLHSIEEFAAFGSSLCNEMRKDIESFEACEAPVGVAVYVYGTMSGRWTDGSPFAGVRFCDRLLVRDQQIVDLQVWSDMGEFRPR
jgi:hypothetical protein